MEGLITAKQVSEKLNVELGTIRNMCYLGKIPFKKLGRLVRFRPSEIERWLENGGRMEEK